MASPSERAALAIEYVTDDRDPTTRDLLALLAIQHGADEEWLAWVDTDEERNKIVDEIVRETVERLPLSRWGAPWKG